MLSVFKKLYTSIFGEVSGGTVARTIALGLALVNQILSATGHSPLPIESETLSTFITTGFTVVTALIAWWKNNSFTQKAIEADKVLNS